MRRFAFIYIVMIAATVTGCHPTPPSTDIHTAYVPPQQPEKPSEPVTGVDTTPIHATSSLRSVIASLPPGLPVKITEELNDRVKLEAEDHSAGWALRCYLCSKVEFERRQQANEVPSDVTYIRSQHNGKSIYRAELVGLRPGQAVGIEPFKRDLALVIDSREFDGDYNCLFLVRENFRVKKLPIWPWSEKAPDEDSDGVDRARGQKMSVGE